MSQENIFDLVALVKSAKGDPSAVVDAVWGAGYRQPPRTEPEAAQITIDTFFYCDSFGMPSDFWPKNYDDVLCNQLMKAVLNDGEHDPIFDIEPAGAAKRILAAGFTKVLSDKAEKTEVAQ